MSRNGEPRISDLSRHDPDQSRLHLLGRPYLAVEVAVLLQAVWRVLVGSGLAAEAGFGPLSPGSLSGLLGGLILLVGYLARGVPQDRRGWGCWILAGLLVSPVVDLTLASPIIGSALASAGGILAFTLAARPRRSPDWIDDRRARIGVALLAVVLAMVALGELGNVLTRRTDFTTFLEAAGALMAGQDPYAVTGGAYFYPPTFAFLVAPLLAVPAVAASLIWFTLKTVLIMHCLAQVFAMLDPGSLSPRQRWGLGLGVLLVTATFWVTDLQYGNTNVVILALCVGTVAADLRGRPWLAGLLLALAITIKLTPVVLGIWLLARRRWRTVAMTAAGLVAWNALPFLWLGGTAVDAWRGYVEFGVEAKLTDRLDQQDNQSLWGFLARTFPDLAIAQLRPIWLACCAALAAGAATVTWRAADGSRLVQATTAGMFLVIALLVSPGSWVVHFSLTTLALAALLRWCQERGSVWLWSVFAVVNLVFSAAKIWRWSVHLAARQSWFCLAALLLVLVLGWVVARPNPTATPHRR